MSDEKPKRKQSPEVAARSRENGKLHRPKYPTPEDLDAKCLEYISFCKTKELFPDEAGMLLYLDISWDTKNRYENNEDNKYTGYAEILKKYAAIRESTLVQMLIANPKAAGGYAFLLKQSKNGGYTDKQQVDSNNVHKIEFKVTGLDK